MSSTVSRLDKIRTQAAEVLVPPERLLPSQSIEKYVVLKNPGAYSGPYRMSTTPYMREPMDVYVSPDFREEIFVGPAQTGKTESLILGTLAHSIKVDPLDIMVVCPTNTSARDFSIRRIDKMHRNSPQIGSMLIQRKDADNKFDKKYQTGVLLTLSWPTPAEMAGKPIPRIVITDRDRMPDDVDGEGEVFDLAAKRTTTFGRFAMCLAESSPSRPVTNMNWIKTGEHEAPPCEGILGLYNRGDRRRWHWPCPNCRSYFEGNFKDLHWTERQTILETAETTRLICPHCQYAIHPDERYNMNLEGQWIKEGERIDKDGKRSGSPVRTAMASFWLKGIAASFITWSRLVQIYLDASKEYERTGSEAALQKFYNNDLGEPYIPKSIEMLRVPEHLMARAENWGGEEAAPEVPPWVRFLIATVDVQKNAFVVQVHGVSPGDPFDLTVVDRFEIKKSARLDDDGERIFVKPATYLEDWDLITERVLQKTYRIAGTDQRMMIKLSGCDSGGKEGVTTNAYNYYRKLRKEGYAGRFHLLKGDHRPNMPRVELRMPDASEGGKNMKAVARGDVPVYHLNSNELKNLLDHRLDSMVPGKGQIRFPHWLGSWFYKELCVETKSEKGWQNSNSQRNEAWDLLYYCLGLAISPSIRVEAIDWDKPPTWAETYENNPMVTKLSEPEPFANRPSTKYDFSRFGEALA